MAGNQRDHGLAAEFIVCFVDDYNYIVIQKMEDICLGGGIATGIVWRSNENNLGALIYGLFHSRDINSEGFIPGHGNCSATVGFCAEVVDTEGWHAIDDTVSRVDKEAHDEIDDFVAAAAYHDLICRNSRVVLQGLPQLSLLRIRIDVIVRIFRQGILHSGGAAVGILVSVQFDKPLNGNTDILGQDFQGRNVTIRFHSEEMGPDESFGNANLIHCFKPSFAQGILSISTSKANLAFTFCSSCLLAA